jgi:uncharacterized protein
MINFMSFVAAVLFGAGLALSGMIDPAKVQGFLDITGSWDPSLAFVMGGALSVTAIGYAFLRRRTRTFAGQTIQWPPRGQVDARLIVGAALFGIGWGASGYCPGPALASLALGGTGLLLFVAAMLVGMRCVQALTRKN